MALDDLATPASTARQLRTFGIRPRKRWGQHFLVSRRALDQILAAADLSRQDTVLEIGAGLGTLTVALARNAGRVVAVEVDPALMPALRAAVEGFDNVEVIAGDIMQLDLGRLFGTSARSRCVVANLPYNVASTLVVTLLEHPLGLRHLVVTVQREVARRMAARAGTKEYGLLSIAVQYRAEVFPVMALPASAFFPSPDVESAVVRIRVRERLACVVRDEALFFRVVRAAFSQRRKTVRNALAGGLPMPAPEVEAACLQSGIASGRRGETLSLQEFAALAEAVGTLQRNAVAIREGG